MIKQKLVGAAIAILSAITIPLTQDITFAAFFLPLGLYVLFTKKKVVD